MSRYTCVFVVALTSLFVWGVTWFNRVKPVMPQSGGDAVEADTSTTPVAASEATKKKPWPQETHTPMQAYPFLVNGVAGYPYNRRNLDFSWTGLPGCHIYALGTPYGGGGSGRYEDSDCLEKMEIYLVTHEGEWANLTVVGTSLDLHDLARELWPMTGKYKFWKPVILFSKEPIRDDGAYYTSELDVIGRFFTEWDKHVTNKVNGYRYEVYER